MMLFSIPIQIAGSTVLAIDITGAQLVVNIVAGNPECTVQQGSSNVSAHELKFMR